MVSVRTKGSGSAMTHTTPAPQGSLPHPTVDPQRPVTPPPHKSTKDTATLLLVVATVLAGALGPMQAAVNGKLGQTIGDGHAAALISFGVGLIFMFIVVFSRSSTRRQALAVPRQIKDRTIPWWNYLAGLCGAVIVLSEGVTVGVLGVATFQISLMSGLVISGVVCDRLGVTASVKQPLTMPRMIGAAMTIVATIVVISPNFSVPHTIVLAIMPFVGGLLAGWQPAGNAAVADASGSMLVSIGWNFLVGFAALLLAYGVRAATTGVSLELPSSWWMYLGGPLGLLSIALMALLVRRLGLLLLGLASVAGQLVGSLILDAAIPSLGHAIHAATIIGTVIALVAAAVGMIPSAKDNSLTSAAAAGGGEAGKVGPR